MTEYDGFPVDVAEEREAEPCGLDREFTDADLMRLAGQLERAELQGFRFERYARCGVSEHRHRWEIVSKVCQIWMYIRRLKWQ